MPINPYSSRQDRTAYAMNDTYPTEDEEELEFEEGELEEGEDESLEDDEDSSSDPYGEGEWFSDLTHLFTKQELQVIGKKVLEHVEEDELTREVWTKNSLLGLNLLGLDLSDKSGAIVEGACFATHPLILETAIKFQSKASTELLPANGPADTKIIGKKTEEKIDRAGRVKQHLNYQLTEKMTEFYPDSEKSYLYSALFGDAFKKTWFDPDKKRPVSRFVRGDLFVISNVATDLESAERYTEIQPISQRIVQNRMASGFYKKYAIAPTDTQEVMGKSDSDGSYGYEGTINEEYLTEGTLKPYEVEISEFATNFDRIMGAQGGQSGEGFVVYEHFCYYDFKDKKDLKDSLGRKLPYVVTVDKDSGLVLSIKRNWLEDDVIDKKRIEYFTQYPFIPAFGLYSWGLIQILANPQMALTAIMRSTIDAGTFSNLPGGFKKKGPRITGPTQAFQPGEFRDIELGPEENIRDVLMPHQFKEPSAVFLSFLQWYDTKGTEFANSTDQVLNSSSNYGPVGTTMALLEAAGKMFAAIYKRFHKAQSKELKILAGLNHQFMPDEEGYPFEINLPEGKDSGTVYREDYNPKDVSVVPVSDPNVSSQAHRIAIQNAILDAAIQAKGTAPELAIDFPTLYKNFIKELDPQADVNEIIRPPQEAQPLDPLSDIFALLDGNPIKAFEGQDHQAHVLFKQSWLNDPDQGGSKTMAQFQPQLIANIREHSLMSYQEKIGAMVTGVASDEQSKEMLMAEAAQKLQKMAELQKTQDTPENKVADAVKLEAETKARKQTMEEKDSQFDKIMKMLEAIVAMSREQNRAAETESKVNVEQLSLLKDALVDKEDLRIKEKVADKPRSSKN